MEHWADANYGCSGHKEDGHCSERCDPPWHYCSWREMHFHERQHGGYAYDGMIVCLRCAARGNYFVAESWHEFALHKHKDQRRRARSAVRLVLTLVKALNKETEAAGNSN
ncbi:MAG: hypothetical protein GY738_25210 [Pseudoalteromonas sp.]|nr:hypothetical protein [Pseudoalteromonas sp.]